MSEILERVPRGSLGYVLLGVLGALVVATVLGAVLARAKPARDFTELNARIRSWWFMAGVFVLAILLSRAVSLAFLAFLSFLALKGIGTSFSGPARHGPRRTSGQAR